MHLEKLCDFFWIAIKKIHSSFVSIGPDHDDDDDVDDDDDDDDFDDDDELVIVLHSLLACGLLCGRAMYDSRVT